MKRSGIIKRFSKKENPEARKELAKRLIAERKEAREEKAARPVRLERKKRELAELREQEAQMVVDLHRTKQRLEEISKSWVSRTAKHFELRKLRILVPHKKRKLSRTGEETVQLRDQIERLERELTEPIDTTIEEQLNDFYQSEERKWAMLAEEAQDIKALFSEERLSGMSVEDIAMLMRKYPNEVVTHVTRQGVRVGSSMPEHTKGIGEFHNGFINICQNGGRLKSALAIRLATMEKEAAIADLFSLDQYITREAALRRVVADTSIASSGDSSSYADSNAVHFGAEEVLEAYYGAEPGNDIFFVFPSQFISMQYHFDKNITGKRRGKDNDIWVWDKEQEGIAVDAGLTFIPAQAEVDPVTGSRFALDEEGNPLPDNQLAENTVSSESYWEAYFEERPDQRPSKIVYYREKDPTEALKNWRKAQGIEVGLHTSERTYDEGKVHRGSHVATQGIEDIARIAFEIIDKKFPKERVVEAIKMPPEMAA